MFNLNIELVVIYGSDGLNASSKLSSEGPDQFIATAAQLDNVAVQVGIYMYMYV